MRKSGPSGWSRTRGPCKSDGWARVTSPGAVCTLVCLWMGVKKHAYLRAEGREANSRNRWREGARVLCLVRAEGHTCSSDWKQEKKMEVCVVAA